MLNRDEPTVSDVKPKLNEELSKEGNYRRTVSPVGPRVVRRNDSDRNIDRGWHMYKNFLRAKPPTLSRSSKPVEIMDWISEMEIVFESRNYSNKQKTIFAIKQLKTGVLLVGVVGRYNTTRRSHADVLGIIH